MAKKTNSAFGTGILLETTLRELGNDKGTCIVEHTINLAPKGASEQKFMVKAIRNNKKAAQEIVKTAPKKGTRVSIWGGLSTYQKEGSTDLRPSVVGGVSSTDSSDDPYASYEVVGNVIGFSDEERVITLEVDTSYTNKAGAKVERSDLIHLLWGEEDKDFDDALIGKKINARGIINWFKPVTGYDAASGSIQKKFLKGPRLLSKGYRVIGDAEAASGSEPAY